MSADPFKVLARLEGGTIATAFATGAASAIGVLMAFTRGRPAHLVVQAGIRRDVADAIGELLRPSGVDVTLVPHVTPAAIGDAIRPHTSAVYVESPSHADLGLVDLRGVAWITSVMGIPLIVDSSMAGPALQRPLALGAEVVLHSDARFLTGNAACPYAFAAGRREAMQRVVRTHTLLGGVEPDAARLALSEGLHDVEARALRRSSAALRLAEFLESVAWISRVHYPWLESSPQVGLARSQMRAGGSVLMVECSHAAVELRSFITRKVSFATATSELTTFEHVNQGMRHMMRVTVGDESGDVLVDRVSRALALAG